MMDWCTVGEDCVAEQFTHFRHDEEKLVERGKMSFPFGGNKWNGRKEKRCGGAVPTLLLQSKSNDKWRFGRGKLVRSGSSVLVQISTAAYHGVTAFVTILLLHL